MAILQECPVCHAKRATKNKYCKCGENMDRAKKSRRVRYWIDYCLPDGTPKREAVGFSIEAARDAHSKRKSQKRELGDRFFEVLRENRTTFKELSEWYLNLEAIKQLKSHGRYSNALNRFNEIMGDTLVGDIKPIDLENYQAIRLKQVEPQTAEFEVNVAQFVIKKADDNDMIDPRVFKAFRRRKKVLKRGENARKRVLSIEEYINLWKASAKHLRLILTIGMHTGMRPSEILNLKWSHIDRKKWLIVLPKELTKEKREKRIPINPTLKAILEKLPRPLHHDFVVTYQGKPVTDFHVAFSGACKRAGIPCGQKVQGGIVFRDIRRTFKTYMPRAGVDKAYRDTIMGHSLKGMDIYYLNPSDDDLHIAMEKYHSWLTTQLQNLDHSLDQVAI
jgi:integrase